MLCLILILILDFMMNSDITKVFNSYWYSYKIRDIAIPYVTSYANRGLYMHSFKFHFLLQFDRYNNNYLLSVHLYSVSIQQIQQFVNSSCVHRCLGGL